MEEPTFGGSGSPPRFLLSSQARKGGWIEFLFLIAGGAARAGMEAFADGGFVLPGRRGHGFMRFRKTFRSASRESFPSAMYETMPTAPGNCFFSRSEWEQPTFGGSGTGIGIGFADLGWGDSVGYLGKKIVINLS